MKIGDTLQTLAEVLGSGQGLLSMLVLAVLTIAAPFADRYVIRRKRLSYRIQYNSKLGLSFDGVDVFGELRDDLDPQAREVASDLVKTLDGMTIVVIRIRNTGVEDIKAADTEHDPIIFSFGGRIIWNARISEPSIEGHRDSHTRSLKFLPESGQPSGSAETKDNGKKSDSSTVLEDVRVTLGKRMLERLLPRKGQQAKAVAAKQKQEPATTEWTSIKLRNFELQAQEKFKLVVVLREPETDDGPVLDGDGKVVLTKEVKHQGRLSGGKPINDEKLLPKVTWPRAVAMVGVALVGVLLATLLSTVSRPTEANAVDCVDGELDVVGSSAFMEPVTTIADEYVDACKGSTVETEPTGSKDGVRRLAGGNVEPGGMIALSDGIVADTADELVKRPLAVIMYAMVVNESVGIDDLSAEQLRGIYSGRYTDWNELRDGPSLPIRVVGRGGESGSRATFERTVLRDSEGALTSDSCDRVDPPKQGTVIRCERGAETDVLAELTSTPGAIGYVDLPTANASRAEGKPLSILELNGDYPDPSNVSDGYPFWTIEYLYTKGDGDGLQESFIDYLRTGTARDELHSAGYLPCVGKDGAVHQLCASG